MPTTCSLSWADYLNETVKAYPWDQCKPSWNNHVGWVSHFEDAPPPPPNSGTLLHDTSCTSYALCAYCICGCQCVARATRIVLRVWDVVRTVEDFFKFIPKA